MYAYVTNNITIHQGHWEEGRIYMVASLPYFNKEWFALYIVVPRATRGHKPICNLTLFK